MENPEFEARHLVRRVRKNSLSFTDPTDKDVSRALVYSVLALNESIKELVSLAKKEARK